MAGPIDGINEAGVAEALAKERWFDLSPRQR